MNLHQVLTGAVNPGDNCFSVGSVNSVPFTAYASGCDVVILGSDFERLQIIPGAKHGNIQVGCVDCSLQGGQIAASYGSIVCIFEPVYQPDHKDKLNCQWHKTGQFLLESIVRNLAWHPTGICSKQFEVLQYQYNRILHSVLCFCVCRTASPVSLMKFSPDGEFFATAGQDDCLVKVWYSTSKWKCGVSHFFTPPELDLSVQGELTFSFIYLAHPRSVTGFSWRKTSKYMPRGSVCNVLLTCCKDSVCRLWAETLLPGDTLQSGPHNNHKGAQHRDTQSYASPSRKKCLHSSIYRDVIHPSLTSCLPHNQNRHCNHRKANYLPHANALCHFHIAASINPATDIPLLPSISSLSSDDDESGGLFTVHWLNNKELQFTLAMEVFLQQLRASLEQQQELSNEEKLGTDSFKYDVIGFVLDPEEEDHLEESGAKSCDPEPESMELPFASVEHQVQVLLEEWNKAADMLFSIHPMDGSLLVWLVDWLDEYQPCMFRQAQVSFVSRIPVAFPAGDAISLSHSVVMYACNKNVDLALQHGRQRPSGSSLPQAKSALISYAGQSKAAPSNSLRFSIFTPNVLMISKHDDGSLNQWAVSFAEDSAFSTVLSVSHKSRYCGHRFHLNDLACHSVLPLLLTTSHHNALRTPDVDNILAPPEHSLRPNRLSLGGISQDPNAIYSELILWRVEPVGPLSLSGGVSELARINSLHSSAFSNVAWLPTLIPSTCLGAYCNSPSACFVASDGHSLRLYQAVIEAKKLLSELSNPEISKYVGEVFNIISQQSTAKPGCIIELDAITDFVSIYKTIFYPPLFSARFFLVVVEITGTGRSLLHMWHLCLNALSVEKDLSTSSFTNSSQLNFNFDSVTPPVTVKSKPCTSNLQSACRLCLTSQRVYSQELPLPVGVEAVSVRPAAGHLSGSCSLPAGHVPYLLATSCSDGTVRFWRCSVMTSDPSGTPEPQYQWEEWPLQVEQDLPNNSVSCCHTGRIAVAYKHKPNSPLNSTLLNSALLNSCESTGGAQWILEQTIVLDNVDPITPNGISDVPSENIPNGDTEYSIPSGNCSGWTGKSLVHLDWVSQENGSHVLTVGIGTKIFMYGLLSGKPPELGLSSYGSKDHSLSQLVLLRTVNLVSSVEGTLPIPVSLSWVRDGILVLGMDCEMHVYSQWQPPKPTHLAQKLSGKKTAYDLPVEMEDSGLFEAAHNLFPTLPQYHPFQLLELMDLGKVHRAKAILSHLVKCIAGEVVSLRDRDTHPEKRVRSRTISAGGSTARDLKIFSQTEKSSPDYTEISSVPPLPLYALLAADEDTAQKPGVKDHPALLYQHSHNLSQYSPTYFGPEHAQILSSHLLHSSLPGLTRMEQMSLMALADTIATTSTDLKDCQGGETLDECGLKFLLAVRLHTFLSTSLPPAYRLQLRRQGLSTCHYAWAFHSDAEEELLNMLPALQKDEPTWSELRSMGVGWWLRSTNKLRRCIEKVAKSTFQKNNDPLDAAIFYLAMKKKAVVWGLYRSQKNLKMTEFFSHNFTEDRWRKAALKNAFSLLGKQRFQHSAAFFLLAGSLKDAVEVCVEKLQDLQLALVISRLYESEFETASTYKKILQRHVLGQDKQVSNLDPFLRSMAYWVLEDYSRALDTLIEQPAKSPQTVSLCNPDVFNFYTYLRTHPLLLRRHFGSSDKSKVGLTAECRRADSISLDERRLFFTAAYAHLQTGCPMLALEVLSKMPKVRKRSERRELSLGSKEVSEEWSQAAVNGYESDSCSISHSDSVLSFDWSQPSLTLPDEALELKWDSDKEEEEEEEEKSYNNSVVQEEDTQNAGSSDEFIVPSDDILAAQLKFTACLKIMTNELRTLSTGYELDGGKLRYQLYQWLEREVGPHNMSENWNYMFWFLILIRSTISLQKWGDLGGDTCCKILIIKPIYFQVCSPGCAPQRSRRHWLLSNQPLLRMFLSYCSLHGSHGGGLASVRMELILLLQESLQNETARPVTTPCSQPHLASIPLLVACTSNVKTVVANPFVYLTNLSHDLLQTINALDSPPHPDIYVLHTLAASLSACIYQCLCDGQTYSHVDPFTGIVYESVLLSQKQTLRTVSMEESVQPNTSPAQWPGIASLIRLLSSAGEESQPSLSVLLCEILTAVYLSLFVHGMATHSSNELYHIMAHPLNSQLWASVFGGGARTPEASPCGSQTSPGVDGFERKSQRFRLLSSRSGSKEESSMEREGPPSPLFVPVVEREATSIFKEQFVPPDLSIWDYFIAKPPLPPSENRIDYDSEASVGSDDDEDDDDYEDVFDPSSPQKEHSNNNSYR
uniref:RAVE complex protein Rav1 C-terminal domain-containing protein n=1 Tax=Periophthalmus magnuspinnatus TaxID=409849 RepID=A0A3B4BDC8_9GOBI